MPDEAAPKFGSNDLRLPDALREPLRAHLQDLKGAYRRRGWAGRVGFGRRPAVIVIDLTRNWLDAKQQIGSELDVVVDAAAAVVRSARAAGVPVLFTSYAFDPAHPPSPHDRKLHLAPPADDASLWEIRVGFNYRF